MKHHTSLPGRGFLSAFALLGLLLAFSLPVAHAQDGAPPTTDAAAAPDRITTTTSAQGGIYYLDYGGTLLSPSSYPITGAQRVVTWNALNPSAGAYDWSIIDNRITAANSAGLKLGIMTTVYDGTDAGDIRSTPDYVIRATDAVVPATGTDNVTPLYINYWKSSTKNGNFDYSTHNYLWTTSGNASIVDGPDSGTNYAAKLGGVNNASGYLYHAAERIPAMPSSLNGTTRVYVSASVYIDTADSGANDHLYMELWDTAHHKISGSTSVDITNLAHTNGTWKTYTFDVSDFGNGKNVEVTFRTTTDAANATTFYADNVQVWVRHLIPKYQSNTFSDPYVEFIHALGARYASNPNVQYISFGTGIYGENQPTQDTYDYVVRNAGLTSQLWIDYANKVTQAHADAFSVVAGQPPGRSLMLQYAPSFISVQEREDTTDYAGTRNIGLSANFLSPDWTQAFKNDGTGVYDPLVKYGDHVPKSFEAYGSDLCNPVLSFIAMAQALDKKIDYQRVDSAGMSKAADKENLTWALPYFGKTAETTPKVWVIMREHRNPTMTTCRTGGVYYLPTGGSSIWPDLGNFDFYLKQVDSIAGGKTVAETNDKGVDSRYARDPSNGATRPNAGLGNCPTTLSYRADLFGANYPCFPQPYNPSLPALVGQNPDDYTDFYTPTDWTGAGKEAYTVRRTDQATSNPSMFFLIDDGYIPGSATYGATITVKYFDIGTDSWSLKYDSTSGEKTVGTITKAGTNTLKTATFSVADGRFGGRLTGGADFYIDSRSGTTNDGDEWVHMVEVERTTSLSAPVAPVAGVAAAGSDMTLTWPAVTQDVGGKSAVVDHYDVWRSDASPYFTPNPSNDVPYARVLAPSFTDSGALEAAGAYYYAVTAVNTSPSALSNRMGKFSFSMTTGR